MVTISNMSNGISTDFCYFSYDVICILKPVDRNITLPRVITLPHFPLLDFIFPHGLGQSYNKNVI